MIAERSVRKLAVSLNYYKGDKGGRRRRALWWVPVCPLGACLRLMGMSIDYSKVADGLGLGFRDVGRDRVAREAREFINDWDCGLITEALGVTV